MGNTLGPSPGATKHPDHRIDISENDGRWTVTVNGARVADSDATLVLNETNYKQVIYFPKQDVRTEQLIESDSYTAIIEVATATDNVSARSANSCPSRPFMNRIGRNIAILVIVEANKAPTT